MARLDRSTFAILSSIVVTLGVPTGQQPKIDNGRVTASPAGSLSQNVQKLIASQAEVAWIGYSVPVIAGDRTMCCFESGTTWINGSVVRSDGATCCPTCRLEPSGSTSMTSRSSQGQGNVVKLEGSGQMTVLLRISERQVERVRVFSEECQLDAGGRQVFWLENVRPPDSIAYLESLVTGLADRRDRVVEGAISAIALHADPAADASLERLVAHNQPDHIRRRIPFWLGNARGRRGLDTLRRIVKEDPSVEVRKKSVFGISQSEEPDAIETLIATARGERSDSGPRRGHLLAGSEGRAEGVRRHHRANRTGSRHRREEESRLRAQPIAQRRRRSIAHQRCPNPQQPRGQETGDVLVGTVEGSACAGILCRGLEIICQPRAPARLNSLRRKKGRAIARPFELYDCAPRRGRQSAAAASTLMMLSASWVSFLSVAPSSSSVCCSSLAAFVYPSSSAWVRAVPYAAIS